MSQNSPVRIGIDVGGTFTHAVAVDARTLTLIGKTKVPTSHRAPEGVAQGIVQALQGLLEKLQIQPDDVQFIAHSTTQATNALLEGDCAPVGIIGMGRGLSAGLAAAGTNPGDVMLAPGRKLETYHYFINTSTTPSREVFRKALATLSERGAKAFAISEAFAVDAPENENFCLEVATEMGLLASAASSITQLYGLRVRTRTAILNAAVMPKMLESALLTEKCVQEANIRAPLMIMRSDGGVMDIAAMKRKPILTMLSGPAAGVAAALMFLRISDGIFIEVGGTSSDISAIHNSRSQVRSAEVGGNRLLMKTLDVRTVGVAGGSLARVSQNRIASAGPRSAHIAGFQYISFANDLVNPVVKLESPVTGDPESYVAIHNQTSGVSDETRYCLTPTCAANLLGFVPPDNSAHGNREAIAKSFDALGAYLKRSAVECAEEFLSRAADKCIPVIKDLIKENKLDERTVVLYGGGGAAAAIVPYVAKKLDLNFELAQQSDVISAIGVALAMVRETIERHVIAPTNDDVLRIREAAHDAVLAMGAAETSIDVFVEYDAQSSILRATATGAVSATERAANQAIASAEEKQKLVEKSMRLTPDQIAIAASSEHFSIYQGHPQVHPLLKLLGESRTLIRVLDRYGTVRFQARNGSAQAIAKGNALASVTKLASAWSSWGDAGKSLPNIVLFARERVIDLSGLAELNQILALAQLEIDKLESEEVVLLVVTPNR